MASRTKFSGSCQFGAKKSFKARRDLIVWKFVESVENEGKRSLERKDVFIYEQ